MKAFRAWERQAWQPITNPSLTAAQWQELIRHLFDERCQRAAECISTAASMLWRAQHAVNLTTQTSWAALWLASKLYDRDPIAFVSPAVKRAEYALLHALDFHIHAPTALRFVQVLLGADTQCIAPELLHLTQRLCVLAITSHTCMAQHTPSEMGWAAFQLAQQILELPCHLYAEDLPPRDTGVIANLERVLRQDATNPILPTDLLPQMQDTLQCKVKAYLRKKKSRSKVSASSLS